MGGDYKEKGESRALFPEDRSFQHHEREECTELIPGPRQERLPDCPARNLKLHVTAATVSAPVRLPRRLFRN